MSQLMQAEHKEPGRVPPARVQAAFAQLERQQESAESQFLERICNIKSMSGLVLKKAYAQVSVGQGNVELNKACEKLKDPYDNSGLADGVLGPMGSTEILRSALMRRRMLRRCESVAGKAFQLTRPKGSFLEIYKKNGSFVFRLNSRFKITPRCGARTNEVEFGPEIACFLRRNDIIVFEAGEWYINKALTIEDEDAVQLPPSPPKIEVIQDVPGSILDIVQ